MEEKQSRVWPFWSCDGRDMGKVQRRDAGWRSCNHLHGNLKAGVLEGCPLTCFYVGEGSSRWDVAMQAACAWEQAAGLWPVLGQRESRLLACGLCWASVGVGRPVGLDSLVLGHVQGIGPIGLLLSIGPWIGLRTWVLGLEPNEKND